MKKHKIDDILNILKNNNIDDLYFCLLAHGLQIYDSNTLNKLILALLKTMLYVDNYYLYSDNLKDILIKEIEKIIDDEGI